MTVLALSVDWHWVRPVVLVYVGAVVLFSALVVVAGVCERRRDARRPLAPVIELGCGDARRRRAGGAAS